LFRLGFGFLFTLRFAEKGFPSGACPAVLAVLPVSPPQEAQDL